MTVRLRPSSSARELFCTSSIELVQRFRDDHPEPTNLAALRGTLIHEISELLLTDKLIPDPLVLKTDFLMLTTAMDYVNYVEAHVVKRGGTLLTEQSARLNLPNGNHISGTADAVIISDTHIDVIDLKGGINVAVTVDGNSQLTLYAAAIQQEHDPDQLKTLVIHVVQPALKYYQSEVVSKKAVDGIITLATNAFIALETNTTTFKPSTEACKWCPIAFKCKSNSEAKQINKLNSATLNLNLYSNDELNKIAVHASKLTTFIAKVKKHVISRGESSYDSGVKITDIKRDYINNEEALIRHFEALNISEDLYLNRKLKPLSVLKLLTDIDTFTVEKVYTQRIELYDNILDLTLIERRV